MIKLIKRTIEDEVLSNLKENKVVVIVGARRTGKTVLLDQIADQVNEDYLILNGEDNTVAEILKKRSVQHYKNFLENKKLLIIDEAQKVEGIGDILKLMIDEIMGLKILITGSSAFDIANLTGEPLTGRKFTYHLYGFSEKEYLQNESKIEKIDNLPVRLVYGNYPELINLPERNQKLNYLQEIVNSYLLKDILAFENIRNSSKILNLLRLVAFQIGSEVSFQELGNKLSLSKNTVEKYLDLLSKVYILHKLEGFSRNLRKEISKNTKWYFYDNGIRNILINNMNPIELRNDIGILWENYIISERIKYQNYNQILSKNYFWRTYDQQEIDWIEERGGNLFAYEMKWKPQKTKIPAGWSKTYPESKFKIITSENYLDWII